MKEVWKRIEEYPDYEISNLGRVKSWKVKWKPRLLKQSNTNGYKAVTLSPVTEEKPKRFLVHRLVAFAFLGDMYCTGNVVNHIDRDRSTNVATNLEWITTEDNVRHSWAVRKKEKELRDYAALGREFRRTVTPKQ